MIPEPGCCSTSFGVEAAARQFGLDFIRMLTEDYFFVCKRAFLETEPMQRVLDIMKGREFHRAVAALPGYVAANTGSVSSVKEFLERMDQAPSSYQPVPRRPGERRAP
jgi:molybdate-binding protein